MRTLINWMRVALIDMRGGVRRFAVLIACLALGTGIIAAVGSVGTSLTNAVERGATEILGGDLEASRRDREAFPDELAFLQTLGQVAHVADANVRAIAGDNSALIDLLAAGDTYPLVGRVVSPQLEAGARPAPLLALVDGAYGALADPLLLDRLDLAIGDRFTIANRPFEVRGTLTGLPDSAVRGLKLGLTTMISDEALFSLGDIKPPLAGLLTVHRYKILLEGMSYDEAARAIAEHFPDGSWSARSPRDAAGSLVRYYDLFLRFVLLVGLSSLLVGGVGVYNGVAAYIAERQASIGVLRTLGATGSRLFVHFLTQVAVLTAVGVGFGVLAGALVSLVLMPIAGSLLSINVPPSVEAVPLLTAAAFGALSGFLFSYIPLARVQTVRAAVLFSSVGSATPALSFEEAVKPSVIIPIAFCLAGIVALMVATTGDVALVGAYVAAVLAAFVLLSVSSVLLQAAVRLLPGGRFWQLRGAVRNIYRAGTPAPTVIVSTGLGLSVLLAIVLLGNNVTTQLLSAVSGDAPDFIATDLFSDEVETLEMMVASGGVLAQITTSPMLSGAVLAINGVPIDRTVNRGDDAAAFVSGEIPMSWQAALPPDYKLTEGTWWPADYGGAPLISLRATLRSQLGVEVGDVLLFRIFGEEVSATVANFQEYKLRNGVDFMVTFSPGLVELYPMTYLGGLTAAEGRQKDLERELSKVLPAVAFISVGDSITQLAAVLGQLGMAVTTVAAIVVINGFLVLASTLAAGRRQREMTATIQTVLGATTFDVLLLQVVEYGLIAAFATIIAALVGIGAAWAITVGALGLDFVPGPMLIALVAIGAVVLTVIAAAMTIWGALAAEPAGALRG
jgi:putative ABC transport system permease protein